MKYLAFIDTETSGIEFETSQILEIGGVKVDIDDWSRVDHFQSFIKFDPDGQYVFSKEARKVNKIRDEDVINAPDAKYVFQDFLNFTADACVIAYNALFDIGHIVENVKRCGMKFPQIQYFDALEAAKYMFGSHKSLKLTGLADDLQIKYITSHRSYDDSLIMLKVVQAGCRILNISCKQMLKMLTPIPFPNIKILKKDFGYFYLTLETA